MPPSSSWGRLLSLAEDEVVAEALDLDPAGECFVGVAERREQTEYEEPKQSPLDAVSTVFYSACENNFDAVLATIGNP